MPLCRSCNLNIAATPSREGYLLYLSKKDMKSDHPYDIYCPECLRKCYPKAILVKDDPGENFKRGYLKLVDELSAVDEIDATGKDIESNKHESLP
jgi:hypothetical protein